MKHIKILSVFAATLLVSLAHAESEIDSGPPEGLKLNFVFEKKQYHLGERIEVTLRYTYKGTEKLAAVLMEGDHPGRASAIGISVRGEKGAKAFDPIRHLSSSFSGGYPHKAFGADGVCEDKFDLNEWVVFETPGIFHVTGWSRAVGDAQTVHDNRNERYALKAEPATIEILPADEAMQLELIKDAEAALKSDDPRPRRVAARNLWYMKDARAIPLLVQCLGDTREKTNLHRAGVMGLLRFEGKEQVREAVLKRMDSDPAFPHIYIVRDIAQLLAKSNAAGRGSTVDSAAEWVLKLKDRYITNLTKEDPARALNELVLMMNQGHADRADKNHWSRIFDNFELLSYAGRNGVSYMLPNNPGLGQFVPQLKRIASDENMEGDLRSSAIMALNQLDDHSFHEIVYEDLVKPVPKLSKVAHYTLGKYKEKERTEALLKLVEDNSAKDLGQRIGNFATAATKEELLDVYERLSKLEITGRSSHGPTRGVLTALALVSPPDALKVIEDITHTDDARWHFEFNEALTVLARLNLPEAKSLIVELLFRLRDDNLRNLIIALGSAARPTVPDLGADREVPASKVNAMAVFPELLDWVIANPKSEVRHYARRTLHEISGIPKTEELISDTEVETVIPMWSKWWNEQQKEKEFNLKEKK